MVKAVTILLATAAVLAGGEIEVPYPVNKLPGAATEVFGSALLEPPGSSVYNLFFFPDGRTIVFSRKRNNVFETLITGYRDGRWTEPTASPWSPFFVSKDRAYYAEREKIYAAQKKASGWAEGKLLVEVKNSGPRPSMASNGNLYVPIFVGEGNLDVFVLKLKDGAYLAPERLPAQVNSDRNEEHLFVAPDESYLLFDSERAGGLGKSDLYISERLPDGSWSAAKNLGASVNTPGYDFNSRVSPDGKFLFYVSGTDGRLHWIDFQAVRAGLRASSERR